LVLAACAFAAEPEKIPGYKIAKPPTIDGTIDAAEWADVPTFEGLVYPIDGRPAPLNSRFWLAYDEEFIYFAARNFDPMPGSIKAVEYRTNVEMPGDDSVSLALDLTGSLSEGNEFTINPRGATNIELAGGRAAKREWTGEFVAKARITAEGWEAEARIPWQLMRIPAKGKRDLRFMTSRRSARLDQGYEHVFTNNGNQANIPYWTGVELPQPYVDRSIKLLPYVYTGYEERDGAVFNSGLDLKTQVSDQITLVGTVNPDFRNIENQILSLDFSRFARIADESRPFFLEGRDYMDTALYASQLIGAFDAGVNAYGRINDKTSFGLIDTIDFQHENAFATNVSYNPDPYNSYRATLTSFTQPGRENGAYMLRYFKTIGPLGLFFRTMGSQDTNSGFGADHTASVGWSKNGFESELSYAYREKSFDPALGFFPDRDYKGPELFLGSFRNVSHGPTKFQGMGISASTLDHIDGRHYRDEINPFVFFELRNRFNVDASYNRSTFEGQLDETYSLGVSYPGNDPFHVQSINLTQGNIGGKDYQLLSYRAAYRPWKRLQISVSHQHFRLDEQLEQTIVGANYDLGNDRSISGRAVRTQNDTNWYLAFRQSGNRGAEYYFIIGDPNAKSFTNSAIVKLVLPFEVGGGSNGKPVKKQISP
jgi:hypothetical protein